MIDLRSIREKIDFKGLVKPLLWSHIYNGKNMIQWDDGRSKRLN